MSVEVVDPDTDYPDEDHLYVHARRAAALPMTGQAPNWSESTPADTLRRAGLTYTERVQQNL